MIVKVQLALHASDGVARCLIYNQTNSIHYETEDADVISAMKDRSKVYFEVAIMSGVRLGEVVLLDEVVAQDW